MPNWIREPASRHVAILQHSYTYTREPGSGFMFDVDEKTGHVILTSAAARENHAKALAGVQAGTMTDDGIMDFGRAHWDAGAIGCHCGAVCPATGKGQRARSAEPSTTAAASSLGRTGASSAAKRAN